MNEVNQMIKAVVFDMDGILFDTEKLTVEGWKQASKELGCSDITDIIGKIMGLKTTVQKEYFNQTFGESFPYDEFIRLGRKYSDAHIAKHGVPLKPGVYELLDYLKNNHYQIAAATSTSRVCVMAYFKSAKITEYFEQIICGDMVEKSKPDPDIYLKAADALKIAPEYCMALEDSPNGLTSAYRAGMKTVMVPDLVQPTPELQTMLFACVPSLNEVIPLLEQQKSAK